MADTEGGDPACWAHLVEEESSLQFNAVLELMGKTATGFVIPPEIVEQLGGGKRPTVVVSFRGYAFRTTIAPMGGRFLLGVSAEHRKASGVNAGDRVLLDVVVDTAPREVVVPDYVATALDDAGIRDAFDALSYTNRKEHVRSVEDAKTEPTRERRLAKMIEALQTKG